MSTPEISYISQKNKDYLSYITGYKIQKKTLKMVTATVILAGTSTPGKVWMTEPGIFSKDQINE